MGRWCATRTSSSRELGAEGLRLLHGRCSHACPALLLPPTADCWPVGVLGC